MAWAFIFDEKANYREGNGGFRYPDCPFYAIMNVEELT
jgi:hypothetical protein